MIGTIPICTAVMHAAPFSCQLSGFLQEECDAHQSSRQRIGISSGQILRETVAHPRDLPEPHALPSVRPDAAVAAAAELTAVGRACWLLAAWLFGLAAWGPRAVEDPRAAWLPGGPALVVLIGAWAARKPQRRRVSLVLVTAAVATLALATGGVLARAQEIGADSAVTWQAAVFVSCMVYLLASWPAFRRAESARKQAEAVAALYEELP